MLVTSAAIMLAAALTIWLLLLLIAVAFCRAAAGADRRQAVEVSYPSRITSRRMIAHIASHHPLQRSLYVGAPVLASFPSGQVVYITSLCGLLAWFALARGNRPIFVATLLLILGIGPFRVVDGAHWPSDVLAGYALALAWTIAVLVIGLPWATGQPAQEPAGATRTA